MKKIITTDKAPAPIGPYNQAVLSGNTLYTSGQIAIIPATWELVSDSIASETKQVMENLKEVLKAADMTFENIVKTSIFISDMHNFSEINAVYAQYFSENPPARSAVQAAALPLGARVEIEAVAILPE